MLYFSLFFFNDTATTEIYTLSLHDALPISAYDCSSSTHPEEIGSWPCQMGPSLRSSLLGTRIHTMACVTDRKSTRLNSSHDQISYAVFCLKKKKKQAPRASSAPMRALTIAL